MTRRRRNPGPRVREVEVDEARALEDIGGLLIETAEGARLELIGTDAGVLVRLENGNTCFGAGMTGGAVADGILRRDPAKDVVRYLVAYLAHVEGSSDGNRNSC